VKELRVGHNLLIASVAPSYVAAFPDLGGGLFPALLKTLGFDMVTETAVGAEMVAAATARLVAEEPESCIASACPVIVSFIA
jgi:iron only hydrogenase large subunit-like protein